MEFVAYGHPGIEGTHKTVLELTQQAGVIPKGDRVIGTRAAFDPEALAALAQVSRKLRITLRTRNFTETVTGDANPSYEPGPDLIIRKDTMFSPGTLVFNADKAAADLPKHFLEALKDPKEHVTVVVERLV